MRRSARAGFAGAANVPSSSSKKKVSLLKLAIKQVLGRRIGNGRLHKHEHERRREERMGARTAKLSVMHAPLC